MLIVQVQQWLEVFMAFKVDRLDPFGGHHCLDEVAGRQV